MEDPEITNRVLLQHMQGMRTAIESRLERLEKDVKILKTDMSEVKQRLENVDQCLGRVEVHTEFLYGAFPHLQKRHFALDERVKHIEEKEMPAIKEHVGMAA